MFILDDILLSPAKGFLWIVRELQKAAEAESANEADELTARLSTLYMQLETGQLSQEAFDAQEREILDRLDAIEQAGPAPAETDTDTDEADADAEASDDDSDSSEDDDDDDETEADDSNDESPADSTDTSNDPANTPPDPTNTSSEPAQ